MSIGELPPEAVAVLSGTPMPPPAPLPIPGGALTPEQLAAASTVPLNPSDPVDAELAKLPASLAPPPPAAPPLPPPASPVEAAARTVQDVNALGEEKTKIAEEKTVLDQERANAEAKYKEDHAVETQKFNDRQERHRQEAELKVTEARAKAENLPFHSYMETRTGAQQATIALGLIIGGISWNENHVNRGVKMLETAMANDMELQKQKHADLWRAVEAAERGETALNAFQLRELSAFNANEGAKWDAIAGRLGALTAANKGRGDVAEAKKQAIEANEKATTFWQSSVSAAASAAHLKEMEQIARERNALVKKKSAAAGGGSGTAMDVAATELREAIEKAEAAGKPMSGGEIERLALQKKIPFNAKAGRTSLKTIMDQIRHDGTEERKDITLGEKAETLLIRDPVTRQPIGKAPSSKQVAKFNTDNINLSEAAHRMKDLLDDINSHGAKVVSPEDVARRVTKYANAVIAIGVVSPLGKTNESLHLEGRSIGLPGAFDPTHIKESLTSLLSTTGANKDAVAAKFHEIENKRKAFINTLNPLSEDEKKKFAGGGGSSDDKGKLVRQKSTGKTGYLKDGKFTPNE